MKKYWPHMRLIIVMLMAAGLFSFANHRNAHRTVPAEKAIEFLNEDALYITYNSVNKLLIQNDMPASGVLAEDLDLNKIESTLNENDMIKVADVYLKLNGELGARIVQRTPIARVAGNQTFYIDEDGKYMPLSAVYSARVPLVTGSVERDKLNSLYQLAAYIFHDDFLKKNVIGIHKSRDGYELRFRTDAFVLKFSDLNNLEKKFNNFKAFYQKGAKDKSLAVYAAVNLDFDNQVVCTKK